MNLIDKVYPHPVLRPGNDDAAGCISFNINECDCKKNYVYINYSVEIENETLKKMLEEQTAKASIWIECQGSFYREMHDVVDTSGCIRVNADSLRGRVEAILMVSAVADISNYKIAGQHEDYQEMHFHILSGDILAVSETQSFYVDEKYDSLANVPSFIVLKKSPSKEHGSLQCDLSFDKIILTLPKFTFEKYEVLRSSKSFDAAMSVVIFLPVLVYILNQWRANKEDFEEENAQFLWFRAIKSKLDSFPINILDESRETFEIAQDIFDFPYDRAFDSLKNSNDTQDDFE